MIKIETKFFKDTKTHNLNDVKCSNVENFIKVGIISRQKWQGNTFFETQLGRTQMPNLNQPLGAYATQLIWAVFHGPDKGLRMKYNNEKHSQLLA